MKFPARLLVAFLLPLSPIIEAAELDPAHAWFKPALVENRSPLCAAALERANQLFYSTAARLDQLPIVFNDLEVIDPREGLAEEQITSAHPKTGEPMQRTHTFVVAHGRKVYVSMRTNPGCGSACETKQMFASAQPFDMPMHYENPPGLSKPTPAAPELTLLKSPEGAYHVVAVADRQLQVFTLSENAAWDNVCKIDLQSQDLQSQTDSERQAALTALSDLMTAISAMSQGAGYTCGTLRAHERRAEFMRDAFARALYRPWTLQGASDASARTLDHSLTEWSAIGFDEFEMLAKFREQMPLAIAQLARFYANSFRWPLEDAARAAEQAVAGAVGSSFAFSSGPMFSDGSARLRLVILENRPVAELEALNWTSKQPSGWGWGDQESMLSVAVKHPAALRWLLSKQLDPNHGNAFGKTPLMYAAQHNALEAVRMLLEHGADPNAATIFPEDTCAYTLERANLTALHYAVRYGSPEIVQALIEAGALPSVNTINRSEAPGQTPLEWLDMFASPNIAEADRPRVAQLLGLTAQPR